MIRRYTTPTVTLRVEEIDLTGVDIIWVTLSQGSTKLTIDSDDLAVSFEDPDTLIDFDMSQVQTAGFKIGRSAEIQVNWMEGDTRMATTIATVSVLRNLLEEVL